MKKDRRPAFVYFKKYMKFQKNLIDTLENICYSKKCTIMARYAYSLIFSGKNKEKLCLPNKYYTHKG